jgi:serine/threonine protein kinase
LGAVANDIPADLASALDARYALHSLLGRGGMATVYLADDRKHHRAVALKVLRPEVASSLGAERFLKEIEIVARLTHPHILAMYDSGEAGGFVYYVMPHMAGGSLRQRLGADRPLSAERALEIAAPVADALTYAHAMGVFHRDIKPENILFSQGHPVIADFGIAKAVSTASGRNLTRTGLALGTPGYMSPEQAAGFGELDARTDVYSLAVVIYEMMVGEIPGRWPTDDAVRAGLFLEAPLSHRARLTSAGNRIETALVRAMAVQQAQRTASPAALLDDLRGVAAPRRRYGADEVDAIVRKASELEASNPTAGAMTIGGVEAIAAEVGIPRELVRSAAQSLSPRATPAALAPLEPPKVNRFIGGPTRIVFERIIDGELAEAQFPIVVDEIRLVMRNVGQAGQMGRSLTWTLTRGGGVRRDVEVLVSARGGRTRVTVQESLGQVIGASFGAIGGVMGGAGMALVAAITGASGHPQAIPFLIPAWLAFTYATARMSFRYSVRHRLPELESLAERLAALVQELIHEQQR